MTQAEKRIWLIKELLKESTQDNKYTIPDSEEEQWYLLRGLFNIRMPKSASKEFMEIQDEFLQEMTRKKGVIYGDEINSSPLDSRLALWQGDITRLKVDAITNACNSSLLGCFHPNHNCVDNIEHTMAGIQMRYDCYQQMKAQGHEEETGNCKITPGYNLPAKYVLHTVGPIVQGNLNHKHISELESCYSSCLDKASEMRCEHVAFCCISTGVFMFPQYIAAKTAIQTVKNWLNLHSNTSIKKVIFNVYLDSDRTIYEELLSFL